MKSTGHRSAGFLTFRPEPQRSRHILLLPLLLLLQLLLVALLVLLLLMCEYKLLSGQDCFEEAPGRAAACTNLVRFHAAAAHTSRWFGCCCTRICTCTAMKWSAFFWGVDRFRQLPALVPVFSTTTPDLPWEKLRSWSEERRMQGAIRASRFNTWQSR